MPRNTSIERVTFSCLKSTFRDGDRFVVDEIEELNEGPRPPPVADGDSESDGGWAAVHGPAPVRDEDDPLFEELMQIFGGGPVVDLHDLRDDLPDRHSDEEVASESDMDLFGPESSADPVDVGPGAIELDLHSDDDIELPPDEPFDEIIRKRLGAVENMAGVRLVQELYRALKLREDKSNIVCVKTGVTDSR